MNLSVSFEDLHDGIFNGKKIMYRDGKSKYVISKEPIFCPFGGAVIIPELPFEEPPERSEKEQAQRDRVNQERAKVRAINTIFDLVYQNEWKYFVTLTFDQVRFDSFEAVNVMKRLHHFLKNQVQRRELAYILTAERHKKGGIHCHLLVNGGVLVEDSDTRLVEGYDKPMKISTIQKFKIPPERVGKIVYNLPEWHYGFSTAIPVDGEPGKLASYMTKYITKDCSKIFGKYYWSSKNLNRMTIIEYFNIDFDSVNAKIYRLPTQNLLKYRSDWEVIL